MSTDDKDTIRNESWSEHQESIEESRDYHKRYLVATNNEIRRSILHCLKNDEKTIDEIAETLNINKKEMKWHIDVLKWGFCIEEFRQDDKEYLRLKKEGEIINYLNFD